MKSRKGQMSPGLVEYIMISFIVFVGVAASIDYFSNMAGGLFSAGNHTQMFTKGDARTQRDPVSTNTLY